MLFKGTISIVWILFIFWDTSCGRKDPLSDLPEDGPSLTALGASLLDQGQVEQAVLVFRKAADKYPLVPLVSCHAHGASMICGLERCMVFSQVNIGMIAFPKH